MCKLIFSVRLKKRKRDPSAEFKVKRFKAKSRQMGEKWKSSLRVC